jgi:hypothetical protein
VEGRQGCNNFLAVIPDMSAIRSKLKNNNATGSHRNNCDGEPAEISKSILQGKGPEGKKDRGRRGGNSVTSEPNSVAVTGAQLHHRKAADKRTGTAGFCSLPRSIAEPFRRS